MSNKCRCWVITTAEVSMTFYVLQGWKVEKKVGICFHMTVVTLEQHMNRHILKNIICVYANDLSLYIYKYIYTDVKVVALKWIAKYVRILCNIKEYCQKNMKDTFHLYFK